MIVKPGQILARLIKSPKLFLRMFLDIFQASRRIVPFYNIKYPLVVYRAFRLLTARGFMPQEALQLGLLELNFPDNQLNQFVSKRAMTIIQKSLNPLSWELLTEDKSIFNSYCAAQGIPIPKLYAVFFRNTAGYSAEGSLLRTPEDWETFINNKLPPEFIIKPTGGAYGSGIRCIVRTGEDAFVDAASGQQYNALDIYSYMHSSHARNHSFIIQERLYNHPELIKLSNARGLQTLRVGTLVDNHGDSRILHAFFKPIVGRNVIDNHDHGRSGNLLSGINLDSGTLKPAVKLIPNSSGIKTIITHPETGVSFEGFPIPLWEDVCTLAKKTALDFLPLRMIGWDIAVTPNGPYIIEGNFWADPPSHQKDMRIMMSVIRENLIS